MPNDPPGGPPPPPPLQPSPSGPLPPGPPPPPHSPLAGVSPLRPLLDYSSREPPPERETEGWGEFLRATVFVLGSIAFLFFGTFGVCGLLFTRGCG